MRHRELFNFMHERHQIYLRRQRGDSKPWTQDPILQQYRFTNAYRELDTITIWIRRNWRRPWRYDKHLWFALAVARYINWPETLEQLGCPIPWNPDFVVSTLNQRKSDGLQVFGGAYFLNSIGPKIESIVDGRLTPLWDHRKQITAELKRAATLEKMYNVFLKEHGFGSFMAAQVVADLKYVEPFNGCDDWYTWAAPGPGSRRGINRLNGLPVASAHWLDALHQLQSLIEPLVKKAGMPRLHAQDLQGWLCEFDKYERVRLGEGRPKQKYQGV